MLRTDERWERLCETEPSQLARTATAPSTCLDGVHGAHNTCIEIARINARSKAALLEIGRDSE